jgi:hypothetical protein
VLAGLLDDLLERNGERAIVDVMAVSICNVEPWPDAERDAAALPARARERALRTLCRDRLLCVSVNGCGCTMP